MGERMPRPECESLVYEPKGALRLALSRYGAKRYDVKRAAQTKNAPNQLHLCIVEKGNGNPGLRPPRVDCKKFMSEAIQLPGGASSCMLPRWRDGHHTRSSTQTALVAELRRHTRSKSEPNTALNGHQIIKNDTSGSRTLTRRARWSIESRLRVSLTRALVI